MTPKAPHGPADPAPRHRRALVPQAKAPRIPSYNEADVSDKPAYARTRPGFNGRRATELDRYHIARQRTLLSADAQIGTALGILQNRGVLDSTYVIFTSDNGYLMGEHRMEGKHVPYEGPISVPFVVRGPGVAAGVTDDRLVTLADLAPTIADLTGAASPANPDGRSLAPVLRGASPPWRTALLVEYVSQFSPAQQRASARSKHPLPPSWDAIRTADHLYVRYANGERELYDTAADPHQLTNRAGQADWADEEAALAARLADLKRCAGDGCRAAEDGPAPTPPETP